MQFFKKTKKVSRNALIKQSWFILIIFIVSLYKWKVWQTLLHLHIYAFCRIYFIQHNLYCIQGLHFFSVLAFSENHEYASAKHYPNNNNNNKYYPLLLLLLLLLLLFNNNNNIIFIIFINVDNYENAVK